MKAKETVIQPNHLDELPLLNRQAEFSFKAGIKEVVDFICSHGGTQGITVVRVAYPETPWWSEKLKEWGIDDKH